MKKTSILNILFGLVMVVILAVLFSAPKETTSHLPKDSIHKKFHKMTKKRAEEYCISCHSPGKISPLPKDHPPKYRCLFCHKKQ